MLQVRPGALPAIYIVQQLPWLGVDVNQAAVLGLWILARPLLGQRTGSGAPSFRDGLIYKRKEGNRSGRWEN